MTETYATYKIWSGQAPYNVEFNGRLCGQRVSSVTIDRDALLKIADDMEREANSTPQEDGLSLSWLLDEFASQIREAIGEEKQ